MSHQCPYCPPEPGEAWGGGEDFWAEMKRKHDAEGHDNTHPATTEGDE